MTEATPTNPGLARAIGEAERIAAERGGMRWEQMDPTHPTTLADLRAGNVITLEIISHGEAAMLARITNDPNPKNNGNLYRLTPFTF